MPIRNFYINCEIDGYVSRLAGGPRAKDGGLNLTIHQRSNGKKIKALSLRGYAYTNGQLVLEIDMHENALPMSSTKERISTNR